MKLLGHSRQARECCLADADWYTCMRSVQLDCMSVKGTAPASAPGGCQAVAARLQAAKEVVFQGLENNLHRLLGGAGATARGAPRLRQWGCLQGLNEGVGVLQRAAGRAQDRLCESGLRVLKCCFTQELRLHACAPRSLSMRTPRRSA